MNGHKLLADTNIFLYLMNGDKNIADYLSGKDVYISFITEIELLSFSDLKEEDELIIHSLLSECKIIAFNDWIKYDTIQIRKENKFKLPDSIIIATSKFLNIPFFTADKKLARVKGNAHVILYEEKSL